MNDEKLQCTSHKGFYLHFLHLSSSSKVHKICSECKSENNIPDSEILSILDLLKSEDETNLFSIFPIMNNEDAQNNLKYLQKLSFDLLFQ